MTNCIAVIADDIDTILNPPPPTPTQRGPVFYHGGQTTVELGDEVIARWFFIRRAGRIVYVPGKSRKNRDMEHHGMCWVGIKLETGGMMIPVVDPKTSCLKKSISFVKRSSEPVDEIKPDERFD